MFDARVDGDHQDLLHPIASRVLHEAVLSQLILAIRSGRFAPGERLRDSELAERLGLSRGTVREALRRLEQEGLVVSQPHRGVFIANLSADDAAEIFSLRQLLESFAVRLAVPHLDAAAADRLRKIVDDMTAAAEAGDRVEHHRQDLLFHEQICLVSGHRHLHRVWSGLALKLWLVNFGLTEAPSYVGGQRARVHLELIDLMQRGDTDAAVAWIERHILNRADEVVKKLRDNAG
ncbi:MAG TPA: GntR family transcriptional regulator [Chloroflexota bacterium]|nr:GntR family transcriptional regulator [Chloroflexota bacterium]